MNGGSAATKKTMLFGLVTPTTNPSHHTCQVDCIEARWAVIACASACLCRIAWIPR